MRAVLSLSNDGESRKVDKRTRIMTQVKTFSIDQYQWKATVMPLD